MGIYDPGGQRGGGGKGHPGGKDNPGPWDTTPYDPYEPDPGGGGNQCGDGMVFSELDENGHWVGNIAGTQGECVTAEEAQRRRALPGGITPQGGGQQQQQQQGGGGGGGGYGGAKGAINFGAAPTFNAPQWDQIAAFQAPEFQWGEQFAAPTYDAATSDPGYQFRLKEANRALTNSQAAKGVSRTGGSLGEFANLGSNLASQEYGNVYDRYAQGYNTRFNTAKEVFGAKYQGAADTWKDAYTQSKDAYDAKYQASLAAFAPKFQEWLTNANANLTLTEQERNRAWQEWLFNHIPATAIFQAGQK